MERESDSVSMGRANDMVWQVLSGTLKDWKKLSNTEMERMKHCVAGGEVQGGNKALVSKLCALMYLSCCENR